MFSSKNFRNFQLELFVNSFIFASEMLEFVFLFLQGVLSTLDSRACGNGE